MNEGPDPRRLWDLFRQARERPEAERDTFIEKACGDDETLRRALRDLLDSRPPEDFLERPVTDASPAPEQETLLGLELNDFRIEAVLGRGGMGSVYRATETGALARPVAIKVVRRGVDTDQVLARFRAEQATLARLNHPALAPVYRAGITPDGRPWFAMEYVDGRPVTDHCRDTATPLAGRVEMMIAVCEAVQHIHHKGIIHRDLKPSNILVRREDGAVKLIDFGIARALEADADELRLTRHHQPVGTPEYMSPEQLADAADLDTRSDVYALGVVLYELLAGRHPFGELRGMALSEAVRTRRPPPPSRHSGENDGDPAAASPGWRSGLRGDLDWIVLKALAPDRRERYPTAAALSDDLRRFLRRQPVSARPPSRLYLGYKFVQRHPAAVIATTAAVAALALLSVALAWRGQQLAAALDTAVAERERAERISGFMVETFSAADPHVNPGVELTARELLDQGRARAGALDSDPPVRARVLLTIANSYRRLGLFEPAGETARAALVAVEGATDRPSREARAEILASLATLARDDADYAAAADHARSALDLRAELYGAESAPVAASTAALGYALLKSGEYDTAEPLLERAVALHEKLGGDSEALAALDQLASLHVDRGRFDEAEALYVRALERSRRLHGQQHPETATRENNLAALYYRMGRLADAARHFENALAIQQVILDARHPRLLTVMNNLGALYVRMDEPARAADLLARTLEGRRVALGAEHMEVAVTGYHLANAHRDLGELDAAETGYREAIRIMRAAAGPHDRRVGVLLNGLAGLQLVRDRPAAAAETVAEALAINIEGWPAGHRTTAGSRLLAARIALAGGDMEKAREAAGAALEVFDAAPGAEAQAAHAAGILGVALEAAGDIEQARPLLERALEQVNGDWLDSERERLEAAIRRL